jgi:hypothetical protein
MLIDVIFFIAGTLLLLLLHRPMPITSIMGISTRSASRPQPIQKATVAKTTTSSKGEAGRNDKANPQRQ